MLDALKKPVPKGVVKAMEIILWGIACAIIVQIILGDSDYRLRKTEMELQKLGEQERQMLKQREYNEHTNR